MLKALEITSFKSFGKKTLLTFTAPITSIVGPNGSGKSNVAEAFQFVLGEQSIKSMRGKRGEDLIFNGGKSASRANRASVKAIFDNTKKILNIDFDEVVIERVVHRDGINEYLINGSAVRLKDVVEILALAHIGPSGHYIIAQGEADRILNSNIKERREIIEDALGLKIYQYKKTESERKLEKTRENVSQVESLRREISPHLKFLKKQVEKLKKSDELKKGLVLLYKEDFSAENSYLKWKESRIRSEKELPYARLDGLEKELAQVKSILAETSKKGDAGQGIIQLEHDVSALRDKKDLLSRELGRVEGEIAWQEKSLAKENDLAKIDSGYSVSLSEIDGLKGQIDVAAEEAEKTDDVGILRNIVARIKNMLADFIKERRIQKDNNFVEEYKRVIGELSSKKSELEAELESIKKDEVELNTEIQSLNSEMKKEKEGSLEAEKSMFRIMAEKQEMHSKLSLINSEEDRFRIENDDFKRELHEAAVMLGREATLYQKMDFDESESRDGQLDRRKTIERMKIRLEETGVADGSELMKEYEGVEARDAFLEKEIADLKVSAANLKILIDELTGKINSEFVAGVGKINSEFQKFFSLMFGGGQASLEIVEAPRKRRSEAEEVIMEGEGLEIPEEEIIEEGIDIKVNLPHKKIRNLTMLSGGERALTSIALLFAMSQVNPPPFIILDETDAALDEANSRKYGDMIQELSKLSQLILITHNRETMSRAGVLYGVTMGSDGISRLLSISFDDAVQAAK